MKKKSLKILTGIFLVLILIGTGCFISSKVVEAKHAAMLKDKVVPLKTVKAGNGFEDLKSMENILKDKKIVSIGEGTHGTKEFFQVKHRMLEFLVEKMGYRLFAMEAGFGDAQVVNDYILNGKGTAKEAVKSLRYWTWKTEEVAEMVEWMKVYNANPEHKTKIKFYGFDMQSSEINKAKVVSYLKLVDSESLKNYEEVFNKFDDKNIDSMDKGKVSSIKDNVKVLVENFGKNKDGYTAKSSKSEYEFAQENLNLIYQFLDLSSQKDSGMDRVIVRDKHMAENVKWILDYEKQFGNDKIMLWAHNGHVTKEFPTYPPMGGYLKKIYNNDMYAIALEFYKGSFRARESGEMKEFNINSSAYYTFAHNLQSLQEPMFFMDFNNACKDDNIKDWLSKNKLIHEIGAEYSKGILEGTCPQIPVNCYDGVIFISKTTPSVGF